MFCTRSAAKAVDHRLQDLGVDAPRHRLIRSAFAFSHVSIATLTVKST
jgi:hypothetical protein